ncbi:hypothetical protein F2P81_000161 [Scophthalmus maximus]|uniref:Uncharacterized protein n=1 Tax=Scophthalmus maximus TaxID=52904 RepID=A0A6A4TQ98_SCOMX|nr:hypothetical protein F2P81_000161 [Scophthalmus maximus]
MSFKGSGDVTNNIFGNREPLSDPLAHRRTDQVGKLLEMTESDLWIKTRTCPANPSTRAWYRSRASYPETKKTNGTAQNKSKELKN